MYRGALPTTAAGSEHLCEVLSNLLSENLFFSYPWNDALGYLFRKSTKEKPIPKIIFVFTNEFDNQSYVDYTFLEYYMVGWKKHVEWEYGIKGVSTVPGITSKTLTITPFYIQTSNWIFPPDPYCLQLFGENGKIKDSSGYSWGKIKDYAINTIGTFD